MSAGKAILIVDDEAIILLALRNELRAEFGPDYRYEIALDGNEGLEVIGELAGSGVRVILVLSDWLMPGMKGDQFIAEVRNRWPGVKTIMVTGQADEEVISRVTGDGTVDALIRKPWNKPLLIETCRNLLAAVG